MFKNDRVIEASSLICQNKIESRTANWSKRRTSSIFLFFGGEVSENVLEVEGVLAFAVSVAFVRGGLLDGGRVYILVAPRINRLFNVNERS